MTPARQIATIVATLLATLLLAFGLRWQCSHLAASSTFGLRGLRELGEPPGLLIMGSSHARQSYDVKQLESGLGTTSYVLSYNGLDPWMMAELAPDLLAIHQPATVILEIYTARIVRPPGIADIVTSPPTCVAFQHERSKRSLSAD